MRSFCSAFVLTVALACASCAFAADDEAAKGAKPEAKKEEAAKPEKLAPKQVPPVRAAVSVNWMVKLNVLPSGKVKV